MLSPVSFTQLLSCVACSEAYRLVSHLGNVWFSDSIGLSLVICLFWGFLTTLVHFISSRILWSSQNPRIYYLSVYISFNLIVYLPVYLYLKLCSYLCVYLPVYLSNYLFINLSINVLIKLSIYLLICLFICLPNCLSICLPNCLRLCLPTSTPTCLSTFPVYLPVYIPTNLPIYPVFRGISVCCVDKGRWKGLRKCTRKEVNRKEVWKELPRQSDSETAY